MSDAPDWLEQLGEGTPPDVRETTAGTLRLTTGRLVACDPLVYLRAADPFSTELKPGSYKVKLGYLGEDVAYASIELGKGKIARWEVARCPDEEDEDGWPGYGVDSGVGCFADAAAIAAFAKAEDAVHDRATEQLLARGGDPDDREAYEDALAEARRGKPDPLDDVEAAIADRGCADITLDAKSKANLVAFRAGQPDGVFASFFGLNNRGRPLRLVTDFGLLGAETRATAGRAATLDEGDLDDSDVGEGEEEDDDVFESDEDFEDEPLDDLPLGDDLGNLSGFEALAAALGVRSKPPEPETRQGPSPLFVQTRQLVDRWVKNEKIELADHADRDAFAEALLEKLVSLQGNPNPGRDVAEWLLDRRDVIDVYASDDEINADLTG